MFSAITNTDVNMYLYADDAKLCFGINNINDCVVLQTQLTKLIEWSNKWGMVFNPLKCVIMPFSINGNPIHYNYRINNQTLQRVNMYNDLGVQVSSNLKWDTHINTCVKRANQRLGLIKRVTGYSCNSEVKLLCYTALVRPLLEFNSQVWSCSSRKIIKTIESVQRRASKYILNDFISDYQTRLVKMNLLPLSYRREYLDIVFFYNSLHDLNDMNMNVLPFIANNALRRTRLAMDDLLLIMIKSKYVSYDKFYCKRICLLWNQLPYTLRNTQLTEAGFNSTFKSELKYYLHNMLLNKFKDNDLCTWSLKCTCHLCRL
jgi:hypothetical protein